MTFENGFEAKCDKMFILFSCMHCFTNSISYILLNSQGVKIFHPQYVFIICFDLVL